MDCEYASELHQHCLQGLFKNIIQQKLFAIYL